MNMLLIGKAEEIDMVKPEVRAMLALEGLWAGGDSRVPQMLVPLLVKDGRVYSLKVDQELDPTRFLDTLTLRGPLLHEGCD